MKFLLVKDLKSDRHFKPIITGLLLFTLLYLTADIFVKYNSLGVTPTKLTATLFGNEEEYLDPMQTSVFLENWHMEIFFMMMILLSLGAVFVRVCGMAKKNIVITNVTLISAFASLIFLMGAFFYLDWLIFLYLVSFYLWHLGSFFMVTFSLWKLYVH